MNFIKYLNGLIVNDDLNILEPYKETKKWIGFWKTPLVNGLYGLKPNMLGDNMVKQKYTN